MQRRKLETQETHSGTELWALRWHTVLAREAAPFVYAVTTTNVFCRTTCGSRRPKPEHVVFFEDAAAALALGFRGCRRCFPEAADAGAESARNAALAQQVKSYLEEHRERTVGLRELATVTGLGPSTVQRRFTRAMGVSPSEYARALRSQALQRELEFGSRVADAVYAAGYSGPSRAAEGAGLGMTPKAYRARGKGEQIRYCVGAAGVLGLALVACTGRGVCAVLLGDDADALRAELQRRFAAAELREDMGLLGTLDAVLSSVCGPAVDAALSLDLHGTVFQARVWAALRAIPRGQTRTYGQLALAVGAPRAVRAVAQACGANPVAMLVPCHRVIGADGRLTGYRWGTARKQALLTAESS